MADKGWMPAARQHRGNGEGPFGYSPAGSRNQTRPRMIYVHRMGGHKSTLDNDAWRHDNWVGVNFGVGRYVVGDIDQYTNIFDAHWGNGIAGSVAKYDRSNRHLADLERNATWVPRPLYSAGAHSLDAGGVNVLNAAGPSIETEDANKDQPWTDALYANTFEVVLYCIREYAKYGWTLSIDADLLVGHYQIDAVNRRGCPGTYWEQEIKQLMLNDLLIATKNQEDDEVKPFLAWDIGRHRTYFFGPSGPVWILDGRVVAELESKFGKQIALSTDACRALGALT